MEKLYEECKELIEGMSRKIAFLTNDLQSLDDIRSEANLVFVECAKNYNKKRGEFKNYLTTTLFYRLYRFIKTKNSHIDYFENITEIVDNRCIFSDREPFSFFLDSISDDAKLIINIILNLSNKPTQKVIRKKLRAIYKWSTKRINHSFYELENAIAC
ncbi:MAG: sigma factor [Candidatus Thorarchaeota archaeon]